MALTAQDALASLNKLPLAQKLKTSKYFANVTIKKASQKNQSGTVEWEINCNANYSA